MKKYSYFYAPILSFFSKDFYRYVLINKKGSGLWYLFLLLAICILPEMLITQIEINKAIKDKQLTAVIEQIPEVVITNGEAAIYKPQPYIIKDPETKEPLAIIDTTGSTTSLDGTKANVLMTKKHIILRDSNYKTTTYDLSMIGNLRIDKTAINSLLHGIQKYLIYILYPFILLLSYVIRIIQLLIYALIGKIFSSSLNVTTSYGSLFRISVIAVTPVILIKTVLQLFNITVPFSGIIFFVIAMFYLFYGIKSAKANAEIENNHTEATL